jgi:hypothetical protein
MKKRLLGTLLVAVIFAGASWNSGAGAQTSQPEAQAKPAEESPLPKGGMRTIKLAGPADMTAVGKSGQYLIFHLPNSRELAILDVKKLEVIKSIKLPSDLVEIAATADKLFVAINDQKLLVRYDLTTFAQDLSAAAPEGGVGKMAAPAGATGPVIMTGERTARKFWVIDPETLKASPFPDSIWGSGNQVGPENISVSFAGTHTLANQGRMVEVGTILKNKIIKTTRAELSTPNVRISGNGATIFTGGSDGTTWRTDLKSQGKGPNGQVSPGMNPSYSATVVSGGSVTTMNIKVYANTDSQPLFTIPKTDELVVKGGVKALPMANRVFLMPQFDVLATLSTKADEVVVRHVNIKDRLEAEGRDYLFVDSTPVWAAERGETISYTPTAMSKGGGVKFELTKGPEGMKVADGKVTWTVPKEEKVGNHEVTMMVTDAAGNNCYHNFTVDVAGLSVASQVGVAKAPPPPTYLPGVQGVMVVRQAATGERLKVEPPKLAPVTTVRGMVVSRGPDGNYHGSAVDIIAARPVEPKGLITIRGTVGKEMRVSLDEAIRLVQTRREDFDRASIDLSFGDKYSSKDGGSAGTAFALLMLSAAGEFELNPDAAVTGDITIDSKVRNVGETPAKAHGAALDKVKIVAIPEGNAAEFDDRMVLAGAAPFWETQIFTIKTLDDAIAVMRKDPDPKLVEAMKLFDKLKADFSAKAPVMLAQAGQKEILAKILELAPNHLSAKNLQLIASGKTPTSLTALGTVHEAMAAIGPVRVAMINGISNAELEKNGAIGKARQGLAKVLRMADKSAIPVIKAMDEFCVEYSKWAAVQSDPKTTMTAMSQASTNMRNKAKAVNVAIDTLFTDKEVVEKLMRD